MKKLVITLLVSLFVLTAHAEFGASVGATFNYKANFRSAVTPGAAVAGIDHIYDDGYNRVDSTGNSDRGTGNSQTTYWGYDNALQYDPAGDGGNGTITMNGVSDSSASQEEAQPAIEIYWQTDLTTNEQWNIGFRTAFRWQRIERDNTPATIADAYSLGGIIPPGEPFDGSFSGPNVSLSDTPVRSTGIGHNTLEADLFGFDFGPTLSFDFTDKLRLTASVGGTVAWIDSEFSYRDGTLAQNSSKQSDWLFGAYASTDLQYQIGEHWGLFGGAAYTRLEDFEQQVDGRSAELQFDDSYTLRCGFFFR